MKLATSRDGEGEKCKSKQGLDKGMEIYIKKSLKRKLSKSHLRRHILHHVDLWGTDTDKRHALDKGTALSILAHRWHTRDGSWKVSNLWRQPPNLLGMAHQRDMSLKDKGVYPCRCFSC